MKEKLWAVAVVGVLMLGTAVPPAGAGTTDTPEISDVAGDANFVNGQGQVTGHEAGTDTRPASLGAQDLLAVWFETSYTTTTIRDPLTHAVLRVEHDSSALRLNVRTEAPIHPTGVPGVVNYRVWATGPCGPLVFNLSAQATAAQDTITVLVDPDACGTSSSGYEGSIVFDGNLVTATFPFDLRDITEVFHDGATIEQPSAAVFRGLISTRSLFFDEAAAGGSFTIGEDVPADVDCHADPSNPACQG